MADGAIERTQTLPDIPEFGNETLREYLGLLHNAIAAMHDELASRINEFLSFQEFQNNNHPEITADQNDFDLGNGIVHQLSTDAPRTITGILAPSVARFAICLNNGTQNISFANMSGLSEASNRIVTSTGFTVTIGANEAIALWYDLDIEHWRQVT